MYTPARFSLSGLVAACSLFITSTLFANWQLVGGGFAEVDVQDIERAPNGTLFASSYNGMYRSTDEGSTWTLHTSGLVNNNGVGLARVGAFDGVTVVGTFGGSFIPANYSSTNNGDSWTASAWVTGPALYDFDATPDGTIVATKRENVVGDSGIWVSSDNGLNWTRRSNDLVPLVYPFIGSIWPTEAVLVSSNGTWYAAVNGTGLHRSRNEGLSWEQINNGIVTVSVTYNNIYNALDVVELNGTIYCQVEGSLFKTTDEGDNWVEVASNFGYKYQDLEVHNGRLYAGVYNSGRVLTTTDGESFQVIDATGASNYSNTILCASDSKLFLTSTAGLYKLDLTSNPPQDIAPVLLSLNGGGTFFTGAEAELKVEVDGTGPFSYQWTQDNVDVPGATGATLVLSNLQAVNEGVYKVKVTNGAGTETFGQLVISTTDASPGLPDPAFTTFHVWDTPSSSFRDTSLPIITDMITLPDGDVWVAGQYSRSGNGYVTSSQDPGQRPIKRLNADGTIDAVANGIGQVSCLAIEIATNGDLMAGNIRGQMVRMDADGVSKSVFAHLKYNTGDGRIYDMVTLPDGRLVVAGRFNRVYDGTGSGSYETRNNICVFNPDDTLDTTFDAGTTYTGTYYIFDIEYDPATQRIYACGNWQNWAMPQGFSGYPFGLVALDGNGAVDTSFNFQPGQIGNRSPYAIAVHPDGGVIIGSRYSTAGVWRNLERINPDGSLDTTFNEGGTGPNGWVQGIQIAPDGSIFALGYFFQYNGVQAGPVTVINPDGSQRSTWNGGAQGPGDQCMEVAFSPDGGSVYVGMDDRYYYYNEDGSLQSQQFNDGLFNPDAVVIKLQNFITNLAINRQPQSLVVNAGESAEFTVIGFTSSTLNYQWRKNGVDIPGATTDTLTIASAQEADEAVYTVRLFNDAGSIISNGASLLTLAEPKFLSHPQSAEIDMGTPFTFAPEAVGQGELSYQWFKDGVALNGETGATLSFANPQPSDSGLYYVEATNDFDGSSTTASSVAVLTVNIVGGLVDANYIADFSGQAGDSTMVPLDAGGFLVGGNNSTGGYMQRLKADGTVDTAYPTYGQFNGQIADMIKLPDGKVLVGGRFSSAFGSSNYSYLLRLNADGTVDDTFTPKPSYFVEALALLPNGNYLVGGYFTQIAGVNKSYLVELDTDGALVTDFLDGLSGPNNVVSKIIVQPDGKILLTGFFTQFNTLTISPLVRINPDGSLDGTFNNDALIKSGGSNGQIYGLELASDGSIYIGGSFTTIDGVTRSYFAKLDDLGELVSEFAPSVNSTVYAIKELLDGSLLVGGTFTTWDGTACKGIVRMFPDGTLDTAFASRITSTASYITPYNFYTGELNILYATGSFANLSGVTVPGLARIYLDPINLVITRQPENQFIEDGQTATFKVAASGTSEIFYRWMKNGVTIPGETRDTLTIASASVAEEASYSVRLFNTDGNATSANALLRILGAPEFIDHPKSFEAAVGTSVTFSAEAIGIPPLSYQWYQNGVIIPNAEDSTLIVPNVGTEEAGLYTVTATNNSGMDTSLAGALSVEYQNGGLDLNYTVAGTASGTRLHVNDDGSIFYFPSTSGLTGAPNSYIARIDPTGAVDTSFNPSFPAGTFAMYDAYFRPDGKIVLHGQFGYEPGFIPINFHTLYTDGSDAGISIHKEDSADLNLLVPLGDSSMLATYISQSAQNPHYFVKLNADGTKDETYTGYVAPIPPESTYPYNITHLNVNPDGSGIFVIFYQVNNITDYKLMKLEADGSVSEITVDPSYASYLRYFSVYALQSDGKILAGSNTYLGSYTSRLIRFNADGSFDDTFTGPFTSNQYAAIQTIVPLDDGKILVGASRADFHTDTPDNGGEFFSWNIVRLNSDGSVDTSYNVGAGMGDGTSNTNNQYINGTPYANPQGGFYVAGSFTQVAGQNRKTIAKFSGEAPELTIVDVSGDTEIALGDAIRLGVAAYGESPLSYQWFLDSDPIPGAIRNYYEVASAAQSDIGTYSVEVTSGSGSQDTSGNIGIGIGGGGGILINNYLASYGLSGIDAELTADPDGDGRSNLLEFLMGTHPAIADSGKRPALSRLTGAALNALDNSLGLDSGKQYLAVRVWRKRDHNVAVKAYYGADLANLSNSTDEASKLATVEPDGDYDVETYYYPTAVEDMAAESFFMYLRVEGEQQ